MEKQPKSRRKFLKGMAAATGLLGLNAKFPEIHPATAPITTQESFSAIEAVVLGSAQDGGIPQAGCTSPNCEAARSNPLLRRRSPCMALLHHAGKKSFLFDAGPDTPAQLDDIPRDWKEGRNPVSGVFLTHAHIGHYTGLMHFGREVMATESIPVYCSHRMADFLENNGPWSLLIKLKNIELVRVKPGEKIKLFDDLVVEVIEIPHRAEFTDTLAFVARGSEKSILYLPDIDRWDQLNPSIEELLQRVDIALIDGTFYSSDELPGRDMSKIPHPPIVESMQRFREIATSGKTQIVFTHLNSSNLILEADGDKLKDLRSSGFEIAHDGMRFNL